ncbi:MAG: protein-glutamate O-methyltransferase CheR [Bermanella sp.]
MSASGWALKPLPDMSEQQFLLWRDLLESRTGIFVSEQRKSYLQSSLMQRMRELHYDDYQAFYDHIINSPLGKIEWLQLVDCLTVQETRFFRDAAAFKYVASFIRERQLQFNKKNPLDIWSVGCSSGEEVYSLAMLSQEALKPFGKIDTYMVTGTDISVPVLNKARLGLYSQRRLSNLSEHYFKNYFTRVDADQVEVVAGIKYKTCFAQVNVLQLDKVAKTQRHIIYCQNLLIYFRRWRREEILNHLVERLSPGGLLLIGMGEMVDWHHSQLEQVKGHQITAYIKRAGHKNN